MTDRVAALQRHMVREIEALIRDMEPSPTTTTTTTSSSSTPQQQQQQQQPQPPRRYIDVIALECNVADEAAVVQCAHLVHQRLSNSTSTTTTTTSSKYVEMVINNAGIVAGKSFLEAPAGAEIGRASCRERV